MQHKLQHKLRPKYRPMPAHSPDPHTPNLDQDQNPAQTLHTLRLLMEYVLANEKAKRLRVNNSPVQALAEEFKLVQIWNELPDWAKWRTA